MGVLSSRRVWLVPAVAVALGTLVIASEAGLDRLGVGIVGANAGRLEHGALMVGGFVGTLIALERARASDHASAYLVPLASAAAAILLLLGRVEVAQALFTGAALGLVAIMVRFWRMQPQLPVALVAAGAIAWAGASVTWAATGTPARAVPWWGAFLVLSVLGERLELTRFGRRSTMPARVAAAGIVAGLVFSTVDWELGTRVVGLSFAVTGAWLSWADTARSTVRRGGTATYAGAALLLAYLWLTVAGLLLVVRGLTGPWYDATLHVLFIGFVVGAIFAHGPIILPALTGLVVRVTPLLALALAVLHGSVLLRLLASVAGETGWREAAGLAHITAFALYLPGMAVGVFLARVRHRSPGSDPCGD